MDDKNCNAPPAAPSPGVINLDEMRTTLGGAANELFTVVAVARTIYARLEDSGLLDGGSLAAEDISRLCSTIMEKTEAIADKIIAVESSAADAVITSNRGPCAALEEAEALFDSIFVAAKTGGYGDPAALASIGKRLTRDARFRR